MKILNILRIRIKGTISFILFTIYSYILWQFDHSIAPLVWHHKGEVYVDGWYLELIFGKEFFEITNVYNTCMLFLITVPILMLLIWIVPWSKTKK